MTFEGPLSGQDPNVANSYSPIEPQAVRSVAMHIILQNTQQTNTQVQAPGHAARCQPSIIWCHIAWSLLPPPRSNLVS